MKKSARLLGTWALLPMVFASGCGQQSTIPPAAGAILGEAPSAPPATPDEVECDCDNPNPAVSSNQTTEETIDADTSLRSSWLEPDVRGSECLPDLGVTDQDGRTLKLSELRGRPLALSFLYTRCTNQNKCPLVAAQMGRLQSLVEKEGLDPQVRLCIMTYDPEYDTPQRLKKYGQDHGLSFKPHVSMLQPDKEEKDRFFDKLQVAVNYDAKEVNIHGLQLYLFDKQGRFVRRYRSVIWDNGDVVADLKCLAQETQ